MIQKLLVVSNSAIMQLFYESCLIGGLYSDTMNWFWTTKPLSVCTCQSHRHVSTMHWLNTLRHHGFCHLQSWEIEYFKNYTDACLAIIWHLVVTL
jgi:hypothetical protein